VKIIRLSTYLDFGGLESRLANISHVQDENEWIFICLNRDGNAAEIIRGNKKQTINLEVKPSIYSYKTFLAVYNIIKKLKPDVVHTSGAEANFHGILAARLAGVKRVISEEIGVPKRRFISKVIFGLIYQFTHAMVGNSTVVTEYLQREEYVPKTKLYVIPNPVIFSEMEEQPSLFDSKKINILTLSRLEPVKNLPSVLRVVKRLLEDGHNIQYHVVGSGSSEEELKDLTKQLDIEHAVTFWGYQSTPQAFFSQADIYILSSFTEGFSNSLVEAMYQKTISVSTESGAASEIIDHSKNGFIVPVDDDEILYKTVTEIIELPDNPSEQIRVNAKKTVLENYSLQNHIDLLMQLYLSKSI